MKDTSNMPMENVLDYIVREQTLISQDLSSYLKRHEKKEMLRLLVAGSVDDGKSTLIGRLLYDSHLIYQDHLEAISKDSKTFNTTSNDIDLSLLTDGLKAEREQGITIDVAYRYFSTEQKSFIVCDAPGHEQYTRNMATGASHCDMALILVDAKQGVKDQTRRHSLIATIMGIRNIVVVVNKMDLVGYSQDVFEGIRNEFLSFSKRLDIDQVHFIPISALTGENVVEIGENLKWYTSEPLLGYLEGVRATHCQKIDVFRFPVQNVLRPNASFRGYAGTIASGSICVGDEVVVLPSKRVTRIKTIETFQEKHDEAFTPMPVVITTTDEVDISRGMVLAKSNCQPTVGSCISATLVWMDDAPLMVGKEYLLKSNTQLIPAMVQSIRFKYNVNELTLLNADSLNLNEIGRVELLLQRPLVYDPFKVNKTMGSFILIDRNSNATSGGGIIIEQPSAAGSKQQYVYKESSNVSHDRRHKLLGHKSATVWLTGLSGSGKSTIAKLVESKLIGLGVNAYILDGDNIRLGLNSDLGFTSEDRCENIRRVGEVAKLMNDAGVVVIAAFVSPYSKDREMAARIVGERFFEVFVDADIETCIKRDPKGLYAKYEAGRFKGLTGMDDPYEKPQSPALHINTENETPEVSTQRVVDVLITSIY